MRIVLLKSQIHHKGGLEKYTLRLAGEFARQGHEVILLTSGWNQSLGTPKEVTCINVAAIQRLSFLNVLAFDRACKNYLQKLNADIVFGMDRNAHQTHYRAGNGVHAAFLEMRQLSEPWYKSLSFPFNPLHQSISHLEKVAFEDPNLKLLFTNSELVREDILRHYKTPPEKIQVIHNGVEWFEMQPAFDQWETVHKELMVALGRNCSSYQLLFAGHNFQRKGLSFLLAGMKKLGRKDLQLSVVGKDKHRKFWKEKVDAMGLASQVTFYGPQPSLKPFYQVADALVVPSVYDPFANVTLEALAMGLYVLSSLSNGAHEILQPESGAKLKNLNDADTMAHALSQLLEKRKTPESANSIRNSIKTLDFSVQLEKIVSATLASLCCTTI